jgi:hypothetical protein
MAESAPETVPELAEIYLGNILFALERTAMALESEEKPDAAGFYRGIARLLAEARGRTLREASAITRPTVGP